MTNKGYLYSKLIGRRIGTYDPRSLFLSSTAIQHSKTIQNPLPKSKVKSTFSDVMKSEQQKFATHHYSYSTHKELNQGGTLESDNTYTQDLLDPDITPNGLTRRSGAGSSSTDIVWTEYVKMAGGSIERLDHLTGDCVYHTLIPNLNWKESLLDNQVGHAYSRQLSRYGIQTVWYRAHPNNGPTNYVQGKVAHWLYNSLAKANSLAKKHISSKTKSSG